MASPPMGPATRVLLLPLRPNGRHWVWAACAGRGPADGEGQAGVWARVRKMVRQRADAGWKQLVAAAEGKGMQSRAARLVRDAVESIDADERFLASIPANAESLHVAYPSNMHETLVRRRARLLAVRRAEGIHASKRFVYGGTTALFSPLMLSPFPNVPLYYTAYRTYMHQSALSGGRRFARTLRAWEADPACRLSPADGAYELDVGDGMRDTVEASTALADAVLNGAAERPETADELGVAFGVPELGAAVELKLRQLRARGVL